MATSPHRKPVVQPAVLGALLLLALRHLRTLGFKPPAATPVLAAAGASKSRAHELIPRVEALLADVVRPPGRPPKPVVPPPASTEDLTRELLDWLMCNPGAVNAGPGRTRYAPAFCQKVQELHQRHPEMALNDFTAAIRVPVETVRGWLRVEHPEPEEHQPRIATVALARLQALLAAWGNWRGDFRPFCRYVREHLRLPFGDTLISSVLHLCGVRRRKRRPGRSPDEKALRDRFETFFAGAQWTGDGSPLTVDVDGQRFSFNLELMVDTQTSALVGYSIRDAEDTQAVVEAFDDGVRTTGDPPLAVLLDNKACNDTDGLHEATGDTLLIHATLRRPQNKGHVEGAYGLFAQTVPPLHISTNDPKATAEHLLRLAFLTWARTLNHRPRRDGKSRVDRYRADPPDPEMVERARQALQERLQRQKAARKTREARQDPVALALLDEAFARLHLDDPHDNNRDAIARYPLNFIIEAIAIFEGKRSAGTLPNTAGAPYLLGIARNLAAQDEGLPTADALWRLRQQAGDLIIAGLQSHRDALATQYPDTPILLAHLVDQAVGVDALLDRRFWLHAAADIITSQPESQHRALFDVAARRAHASWRTPVRRRADFVRHLARILLPLE